LCAFIDFSNFVFALALPLAAGKYPVNIVNYQDSNLVYREYDVPYHVRVAIDLKIFVVSKKYLCF